MNATALAPTTPSIRHMDDLRVATVRTIGDPAVTGRAATASLYAAVGGGAGLRARWPNAHVASREEWVGLWALPLPAGEPRSLPGMAPVAVETWTYGDVAEIVHVGPYATEGESIARLHHFIGDQGYEIVGTHEEEYLTPPGAPEQRTLIRYVVRKRR
jgi:hypothetical protein